MREDHGLSSTYRQSSDARPDLEKKDPANILLARQSRVRLPAELIRDEALGASGLLEHRDRRPQHQASQPAGVAELGYGAQQEVDRKPRARKYRRGLYIHYQRTTPYPFLVNFDEPDSTSPARAAASNTPLQSLDLLNDPVFFEAARRSPTGFKHEAPGDFQRAPELRLQSSAWTASPPRKNATGLLDLLTSTTTAGDPPGSGISRVLLNLDEFITRE